jgi:hypothetical protein
MKFWGAPRMHCPVREIEAIVYGRIMGRHKPFRDLLGAPGKVTLQEKSTTAPDPLGERCVPETRSDHLQSTNSLFQITWKLLNPVEGALTGMWVTVEPAHTKGALAALAHTY